MRSNTTTISQAGHSLFEVMAVLVVLGCVQSLRFRELCEPRERFDHGHASKGRLRVHVAFARSDAATRDPRDELLGAGFGFAINAQRAGDIVFGVTVAQTIKHGAT